MYTFSPQVLRFFIKFFENQPMYRKIGHCLKFSFFLFVADKNPRFLSGFFVWSCLIILRILQSVYFFLLLFNCLTTWPRLTSHREKSNKIRDTGISSLLFDLAKKSKQKTQYLNLCNACSLGNNSKILLCHKPFYPHEVSQKFLSLMQKLPFLLETRHGVSLVFIVEWKYLWQSFDRL